MGKSGKPLPRIVPAEQGGETKAKLTEFLELHGLEEKETTAKEEEEEEEENINANSSLESELLENTPTAADFAVIISGKGFLHLPCAKFCSITEFNLILVLSQLC